MGSILARSPDTVRGPYAPVIRADRLPPGPRTGFLEGAPDLAIEIVSPSNRDRKIREKVTEYLAAGASCFCVIRSSPAHRGGILDAWVKPCSCESRMRCSGDGVLPGFRLKLSEFFGSHSSGRESRSG